jgi:hypothetical protein
MPDQDESSYPANPAVDSVVARIGTLDERPLAEHVAEFEAAHRDLRSALDDDQQPNDA